MLKTKILLAALYDLILILAVLFFAGLPFVLWQGGDFSDKPMVLLSYQIYLGVISYIYFSYFWLINGQTPGLRTWNLRLIRQDGYLLTRKDSIIRFILSLISIATLGIGWLWLFFNRDNQSFHDQFSYTQIVFTES